MMCKIRARSDGKSGAFADPCFLIQHPKGLLLWDIGLGDDLVGKPAPKDNPFHPTVAVLEIAYVSTIRKAKPQLQLFISPFTQ